MTFILSFFNAHKYSFAVSDKETSERAVKTIFYKPGGGGMAPLPPPLDSLLL